MESPSLQLPVPDLFDYRQLVERLMRAASEIVHQVENDRIYKCIPWNDEDVLLELSDGGDCLRIWLPTQTNPPNEELLAHIADYVKEWLDLDTNLTPFYALAARDPLLAEAANRFRGLWLIGIPDLYEALSWGILGQQINLSFAYTLKRRLVQRYGSAVHYQARTYWRFPDASRIAAVAPSELQELQISGRKAEYLIDIASRIAAGTLSKEGLRAAGDAAADELVALRGIGPWTAQYVLMHCLRRRNAFPVADVGLHQAIRQAAGLQRKPTPAEVSELGRGWSGWEAYAVYYLWRLLY
ncbi:DNA-3-methyladenine glycosylase 2 family protein [Paenibacillus sp. IB182496]|uniref:DNA-3-methyladenine glycosylase II n=1 Tax=Paenibacillus sabuli TaxID=2772509 RepID=A0A927GTS4_9BACL|nr:DNA-3-methyladenine glycosylase [Paenibacillus sabuli]MBD2847923.1 DNA-3-methyladenine glycosylase 2 family protein [Paenibacillus sabuli]